jgi:hypothetical protein
VRATIGKPTTGLSCRLNRMTIILTPFAHGDLCHGATWTIGDERWLAERIALVAVGQSLHVERVLAGANIGPPPVFATAVEYAIAALTLRDGAFPYHRDGWLLQVMSWLAAHTASPGGLISPPHMIQAHKGFDGLQLKLSGDGMTVSAAIVFEDKATDNPRDTIRDEVWPDIRDLEAGKRDNVLVADLNALLRTRPQINPDDVIRAIVWREVRHYRVSITVGDAHADDDGRARSSAGTNKRRQDLLESDAGRLFTCYSFANGWNN